MKKIIVLIANYGSGKTEIALNLAMQASMEGKRTQVIDLDRINDYFRMSDQVKLLQEKKIDLVSPTFVGSGITQTNMPATVNSAFDRDWDLVIFDVGGDPAGALSLARYRSDFDRLLPEQIEVYDVVNVCRMMSQTPEKILKLKEEMETFARMKVTGFIHNSNLQDLASADDLRMGYPVRRGTVLYLALEDDYGRLQKRLYQMFGTDELKTADLYIVPDSRKEEYRD